MNCLDLMLTTHYITTCDCVEYKGFTVQCALANSVVKQDVEG